MMIRLIRRFLVVKLALIVVVAVVAGFSAWATVSSHLRHEAMSRLHKEAAASVAKTIGAGVKNAMLTGNGRSVRDLLTDTQAGLTTATVKVYAPEGEEVFGKKPPPPPPDEIPPSVQQALRTGKMARNAKNAESTPILNASECRSCHPSGDYRGVLTMKPLETFRPAQTQFKPLSAVLYAGFTQIMTGRKEDELDAFFKEVVKRSTGIQKVAVYDMDGDRSYGADGSEFPAPLITQALSSAGPTEHTQAGLVTLITPMDNEPRCRGCHEPEMTPDGKIGRRGALAIQYDPKAFNGFDTFRSATDTSLRHVMLCGLGRLITAFMNTVRDTQTIEIFQLHDPEGRLYHDPFQQHSPPAAVAEAIKTNQPVFMNQTATDGERLLFVEPLVNEKRCQSCHGTDRELRGVVSVSLDTSREARERNKLSQQTFVFAGVTIFLVVLLLYFGLRTTVLKPVHAIENVTHRIGEGDLEARVELSSLDEMGRLARRINGMGIGLKEKLALSKFVSKATVDKVSKTEGAEVHREGERRTMTILFSDIRGFTSFSEKREPEEVVMMLNAYLQVQSECVMNFGGDIDKFVGDELMARFDGEDHERRAAQCALAMVGAVAALNEAHPEAVNIEVGVGLNAGEVVFGAMGSNERMDFTAIGDAVNLAARLCSAADRGAVLVSESILSTLTEADNIRTESLAPIKVKGKEQPVVIARIFSAS